MDKKLFQVVETRPATSYWVYIVEAESEEEAKKLVDEGERGVSTIEHFTEVDWDAEEEFEYQEIQRIEK